MSATLGLGSPEYHLTSDLNRECLPGSQYDPDRWVSWANALCLGVLTVGVLMTKQPAALVFNRQAYEPPAVLPVEDVPPEVPDQVRDLVMDEVTDTPESAPAAPVVVVAAEPAAVPFAVPVVGATVASFDLRTVSAPPVLPISGTSTSPGPVVAPPSTLRYGERGARGDLPWPTMADYPQEARDHKEVGDVILIAVVTAEGGLPSEVIVEKGSGSFRLDAHARDWVKNRWKFFPGNPQRWRFMFSYELPGVSR
ncbi:MAG: TonB family protein [Verrucomicrobiota bacterium]